jgi:HPt (histidine-containing phosphotransfer) domain-containing protein
MSNDIEACLQAGCDRYLGKPFERKDLFALLSEVMPAQTSNAAQVLLPELEEEDEELRELVGIFVEGLPHRLELISAAVAAQDWTGVQHLSHALRGAAFAYPLLVACTAELEHVATGGTGSSINEQFQKLRQLVERIMRGSNVHVNGAHGTQAASDS